MSDSSEENEYDDDEFIPSSPESDNQKNNFDLTSLTEAYKDAIKDKKELEAQVNVCILH